MNTLIRRPNAIQARPNATPVAPSHPAMRKLFKAAQARAVLDFNEARLMLIEADLCFATQPAPGAERAMLKAKKLILMEERAAKMQAQIQAQSRKRLTSSK